MIPAAGTMVRAGGMCGFVTAASLALAGVARAEDGAVPRAYLHLRFGESIPLTRVHDAAGVSVGLNLSRHLGFELAMDDYELFLDVPTNGKVGELDLRTVMPQARLRSPLLGDRLVPYVLGGVGVVLTQVNDSTTPITWSGGLSQARVAGALGVGLEYFLTDDVALGVEGKYVIAGEGHYTARGQDEDVSLNAALWTFGLRLFYPELHPAEGAARARQSPRRIYLTVRTGGALLATSQAFADVSAHPEQAILGSSFTVLFGAALGVTLGRHAAIELSLENRELALSADGTKGVGEYSLFPLLLQPRLRYPLLDGRLEPYVVGGVGVEVADVNDTPDSAASLDLSADDVSVVGALGVGFDYFLTSDISIGCEAKYLVSRGHELEMGNRPPEHGDLDAFFLSIGVRAYFFDL